MTTQNVVASTVHINPSSLEGNCKSDNLGFGCRSKIHLKNQNRTAESNNKGEFIISIKGV